MTVIIIIIIIIIKIQRPSYSNLPMPVTAITHDIKSFLDDSYSTDQLVDR